MEKEDLRKVLYITVGLTIGSVLLLEFFGNDMFSLEGGKKVSTIFSGIVVLWMLYFSYGWRAPILKHILYKTDLNGTWFGEYYSKNLETKEEFRGEIALIIRQSFLNINITSYTEKHLSFSFAETLLYKKESERSQLVYLYSQNEFDPTDENTRKGTSELEFIKKPEEEVLVGSFWTNVNSKGKINVVRLTKRRLTSFEHTQDLNSSRLKN